MFENQMNRNSVPTKVNHLRRHPPVHVAPAMLFFISW